MGDPICILLIWMVGDDGHRIFVLEEGSVHPDCINDVLDSHNRYLNTDSDELHSVMAVSESIELGIMEEFEITDKKEGVTGEYFILEYSRLLDPATITHIVMSGVFPDITELES